MQFLGTQPPCLHLDALSTPQAYTMTLFLIPSLPRHRLHAEAHPTLPSPWPPTHLTVRELQKQLEVLNCEVQVLKFSTIVADKVFQYNEDNMTRGSNAPFKTNLLQAYGSAYGSTGREIRCMLSGKLLPSRLVIASHIVKHSWQEYGIHEAMGFSTDDVGNGLLLFKPFEWAFDNSKLCFVYDHRFDHFVMHILDPGLRALPVIHMFHHPGVYTPHVQDYVAHTPPELVAAAERAFADTTFNDYHAHWLKLPEATRPFKRALCFHAHRARRFAISSGWFDDSEWRFDDFWSEGAPNQVELWLAAVEEA